MKKRLSTMMVMVMALGLIFAAGSAWALDAVGDAEMFTLDNAQAIEISNPNGPASVSGSITTTTGYTEKGIVDVGWQVTSNNGFDVSFSGSSVTDTNQANSFPLFTKQDVDATGALVANSFDHLDTAFCVVISAHESIEGTATWGGTSVDPSGDKEHLVLALDQDSATANSPDETIGCVMTDDALSTATVTLYAEGTTATGAQSGNYTATVTCTVTPNEQEN